MNNMGLSKHNSYKIGISKGKCHCVEVNGQKENGFVLPDVADNIPKLYVVKHDSEIYYVGITRQDIRKRLRTGFSAKGEHGYYGYKWKDLDQAGLLVWTFPHNRIESVEAIEAEVVFLIRQQTGHWPKYQMEIHFHHGASDEEKRVAESVLNVCLKEGGANAATSKF